MTSPTLHPDPDLVFQEGPYTIRPATPADRDAILETFNLVFSEGNPGFVPRRPEVWDWTYAQNPAGMQAWVAVIEDGTVCAQFASLPERIRMCGEDTLYGQIVDSLAHPDHRAGLKRPGLWVKTGTLMVDHYGRPERDSFMYGYPVPHAFRIGQRFLGYHVIRTQLYLTLPTGDDLDGGAPRDLVEEVTGFDDSSTRLFERICPPDGAMAIRDPAFLTWRYVDHPLLSYRFGVVRDGDELRGLAAFRCGEFSNTDQGLLVEWMVAPGDDEAARALLSWGRDLARAEGRDQLGLLLADCDPWWLPIQRMGFTATKTKYSLVGRSFLPDRTADWLRDHWLITLGDSDLA